MRSAALILIPIAGVGFVAALYSVNYMGRQYERGIVDDRRIVRYYQGFNAFMLTMLLVPLANNMGLMWVAIEATTLVSVFMIMLYTTEGAIEAAWKYLTIATVGLSLALFGIVLFSYANTAASPSASGMDWTSMVANSGAPEPGNRQDSICLRPRGSGDKGRPRADAHVASRRPWRGADARQRAPLGRPAELRHLRRAEVLHRRVRARWDERFLGSC